MDLTGGPHFKAKATPCLRCLTTLDDIPSLATFPNRDSSSHNLDILDQNARLPLELEADKKRWVRKERVRTDGTRKTVKPYPDSRQKETIKRVNETKGTLSALCLLPDYDKFAWAVFDPMHSLLEGACKTYFHRVLVLGVHEKADDEGGGGSGSEAGAGSDENATRGLRESLAILEELKQGHVQPRDPARIQSSEEMIARLQRTPRTARRKRMFPADILYMQSLLQQVVVPSSVNRLHPLFGSPSAGTPSANHWRMFATVYGPLVMPLVFLRRGRMGSATSGNSHLNEDEQSAIMMIYEIICLAMRSSISEKQVAHLEKRIKVWQELAFRLHPTLKSSTNLHVLSHLATDIRRYGPCYGWWSFLIERINFIIKNTNRSGGSHDQAQVVALRAVLRTRDVLRARLAELKEKGGESREELDSLEDLQEIFGTYASDPAHSTLEQIAVRYAEMDKGLLDDMSRFSAGRTPIRSRGRQRQQSLSPYITGQLQKCLLRFGVATRASIDPGNTVASSPSYLLGQATFWEGMTFDGRRLDAAQWSETITPAVDVFESIQLARHRNSCFEVRPNSSRYDMKDKRCTSGVLCGIFEHQRALPDGSRTTPWFYGIIRRFKGHEGRDPYGYRAQYIVDRNMNADERSPALHIWLWEVGQLADAEVVLLSSQTADALLPLAWVALPLDDRVSEGAEEVWATIPVHHVCFVI